MDQQATYNCSVEAQIILALFLLLHACYEDYSAWIILSQDVISPMPLLLGKAKKPKTKVHNDNGLPSTVLSSRVICSSSGDKRVP